MSHFDDIKTNFDSMPSKTATTTTTTTPMKPVASVAPLATVTAKRSPSALCGMSCPGLKSVPPSLHCQICMCMYHPQCVGVSLTNVNFVCTVRKCKRTVDFLAVKLIISLVPSGINISYVIMLSSSGLKVT